MEHAPSIYQFRNTVEWEQAMVEWCAEYEPKDNETTLKSNAL
jgi:hypothetical protein